MFSIRINTNYYLTMFNIGVLHVDKVLVEGVAGVVLEDGHGVVLVVVLQGGGGGGARSHPDHP